MARIYQSANRTETARVRALGCKLLGYPRAGTNVGKGVHNVDLTTPPAMGEEKPGWTSFDKPIVPEWDMPPPEPDTTQFPPDRWALSVADYEAELIIEDARPARDKLLTTQERAECTIEFTKVIDRNAPRELWDDVKGRAANQPSRAERL